MHLLLPTCWSLPGLSVSHPNLLPSTQMAVIPKGRRRLGPICVQGFMGAFFLCGGSCPQQPASRDDNDPPGLTTVMKWEDQTYRQSSQFPSSLDTGLWWPRPWVRLKRTRGGPFAPPLPCLTVPEETPGAGSEEPAASPCT